MLRVTADLTFSATVPARRGTDEVHGRVHGSGQVLTVELRPLPSLGPRLLGSATTVARTAARQLADQGLTVLVTGPDEKVVVELGHGVRAPRWQRLLTRTPAIRITSLRACLQSLRGPRLF